MRTYESKAIETYYKGYRFRSRLEAKWAVFFDALGVPWEYEQQGFVTSQGPYLPDFWLPHSSVFAEVKPSTFNEQEFLKCRYLPEPCLLLDGMPSPKHAVPFSTQSSLRCLAGDCGCEGTVEGDTDEDTERIMNKCRVCSICAKEEWLLYLHGDTQFDQTFISYIPGRSSWLDFGEGAECYSDDKEFVAAMNKARSARFEHGESPR